MHELGRPYILISPCPFMRAGTDKSTHTRAHTSKRLPILRTSMCTHVRLQTHAYIHVRQHVGQNLPTGLPKKRPSVRPSGCASSLKDAAAALISACTRGLSSRHMGPVWSAKNTTPDKPTVFRAPHSEFPLLVIKRCFFGRVMA